MTLSPRDRIPVTKASPMPDEQPVTSQMSWGMLCNVYSSLLFLGEYLMKKRREGFNKEMA